MPGTRPGMTLSSLAQRSRVLDVLLETRIDQFALHQSQRRLVVQLEIAEGVGEDLRHPDQTGLDVTDEEQVDGAEQQPAGSDHEPDLGHLAHEVRRRGPGREQAEQGRVEIQYQRRQRPDRHQYDLALQIVADLDLFLVLVRRLVDVVVSPRLEEEVTGLPRGHGDQPADERRYHGIDEQHRVSKQKARGADEVQRLVDTAVVIEAMVVPALGSQFLQEVLDHSLPPNAFGFVFTEIRCPACDIIMLTCDGLQRRDDATAAAMRQAAAATSTLRKRTREKCPSGGTRRRSASSMPRAPASHCA